MAGHRRSNAARLLWELRREPKSRDHAVRFVLMGLKLGQRPAALFELHWTQIDWENNLVNFNQPGAPRSNKRSPVVPIPRRLRWFLEHWQARATSPYVIAYDGKPLLRLKKSFAKACRRAGLGPDVVPYTLRHTCTTWAMQKGVDPRQAAGWLGHSLKTRERYQHHHPRYMDEMRRVMD